MQDRIVASDFLLELIRSQTLEDYLCNYRQQGVKLYIPFAVRAEIEDRLDDEDTMDYWHKLLGEGLAHQVIVKTRKKYNLEHDYKALYKNIDSIDNGSIEKLTDAEKHVIVLCLQEALLLDSKTQRSSELSIQSK